MTVAGVAYLCLLLILPAYDATQVLTQDQTVGGQPGARQTWPEASANASQPIFKVSAGQLTIQDVDIDVTSITQLAGGPDFAAWLQLPWLAQLAPGAQLSLQRVNIHMHCGNLQQIQAAACSMADLGQLRSLQVLPGLIHLPSWSQASISMQQVQLRCATSPTPPITAWHPYALSIQPNNTKLLLTNTTTISTSSSEITSISFMFSQVFQNSTTAPFLGHIPLSSIPVTALNHSTPYDNDPAGAPLLQCVVAQVSDWQQLVSLTYGLQAWANTLHLVLTQNISITQTYRAANNGTTFLYREVFLVPHPSWPYPTLMDLGYRRGLNAWAVSPNGANITFDSLLFISMPQGPPSKLPWSLYIWNMWAVNTDTCQTIPGVNITIQNCIMLLERQTMDYMSYWANELASPFPDRRAAASWYLNDTTCGVVFDQRDALAQNVDFVDQHNWHVKLFVTRARKTIINSTLVAFPDPQPLQTATQGVPPVAGLPNTTSGSGSTAQLTMDVFAARGPLEAPGNKPTVSTDAARSTPGTGSGSTGATAARALAATWTRGVRQGSLAAVASHTPAAVATVQATAAASHTPAAVATVQATGSSSVTTARTLTARATGPAVQASGSGQGRCDGSAPAAARTLAAIDPTPATQGAIEGPGVPGGTSAALAAYMEVAGTRQHFALTDFFENPYTPFNKIKWVTEPLQFVQAITDASTPPNIALLMNISVPVSMWPAAKPVVLKRSMVIAGWLGVLTLLDWQGASGIISLPDAVTVTHRHLTVMNAGMGDPATHQPSYDAYYTAYQWQYNRAPSHTHAITFLDANLLLPAPELSQLSKPGSPVSQALGNNDNPPDLPFSTGYMNATGPNGAATSTFLIPYRGADPSAEMQLKSFTYASIVATDITLNTAPAPGSGVLPFSTVSAPYSVNWASVQPPVGAAPAADPSTNGSRLGLAVGLPVGLGVAVITAILAAWLISRRRAAAARDATHSKASPTNGPVDEETGMLQPSPARTSAAGSETEAVGQLAIPASIQQAYSSGISVASASTMRPTPMVPRGKNHRLSWMAVDDQPPVMVLEPPQPNRPWLTRTTTDGDDDDWDDFDAPPDHDDMLLINNLDVSRDFRGDMFSKGAADVAAGLRDMVARMQQELGSEEFQIERVLGKGGGGVVYQGTWRGLVVAVKVVEFTVTATGHMSRAHHRAITEAALCKTLQHPNIVATYAYDLHSLDAPSDPLTSRSAITSSSLLGSGPRSLPQQPSLTIGGPSGILAGPSSRRLAVSGCPSCQPGTGAVMGSVAGVRRATSTPLCQAGGQAGGPIIQPQSQPLVPACEPQSQPLEATPEPEPSSQGFGQLGSPAESQLQSLATELDADVTIESQLQPLATELSGSAAGSRQAAEGLIPMAEPATHHAMREGELVGDVMPMTQSSRQFLTDLIHGHGSNSHPLNATSSGTVPVNLGSMPSRQMMTGLRGMVSDQAVHSDGAAEVGEPQPVQQSNSHTGKVASSAVGDVALPPKTPQLLQHVNTMDLGSGSSLQQQPSSQPVTMPLATHLGSQAPSSQTLPAALVAVTAASPGTASRSSMLSPGAGSRSSILGPTDANPSVTRSSVLGQTDPNANLAPMSNITAAPGPHPLAHVTFQGPPHGGLASSEPRAPSATLMHPLGGLQGAVAGMAGGPSFPFKGGALGLGSDASRQHLPHLLCSDPSELAVPARPASAPVSCQPPYMQLSKQLHVGSGNANGHGSSAAGLGASSKSEQQLQTVGSAPATGSKARQQASSGPIPTGTRQSLHSNLYNAPGLGSGFGGSTAANTTVSAIAAPLPNSGLPGGPAARRRSSTSQVLPVVSEVGEAASDAVLDDADLVPLTTATTPRRSARDSRHNTNSGPSNQDSHPALYSRGPGAASAQLAPSSPAPSGQLGPGSPATSKRPSSLYSGSPAEGLSGTVSKDRSMRFRLYIIQEYCDGGTLKAAIDEHRLQDMSTGEPRPVMSHVLQLACDMAAGLAHVHSRRVIHGDLTPANVLLRSMSSAESGFAAKIADFGLSWKLPDLGQGDHVPNAKQGTRFYMAPEVKHVGIMSKSADIFSFGMLMHEMFHGTPFWRRPGVSLNAELMAAASRHTGESLQWDAKCPADYRRLVMSCVANDPNARPTIDRVVHNLLQQQRTAHEAALLQQLPAPMAPPNPLFDPNGQASVVAEDGVGNAGVDTHVELPGDMSGLPLGMLEGETAPVPAAVEVSPSPSVGSISIRGLQKTSMYPSSRASDGSETTFQHTPSGVSTASSGTSRPGSSPLLAAVPSVVSSKLAHPEEVAGDESGVDPHGNTAQLLQNTTTVPTSPSVQRTGFSEPLRFIRSTGFGDDPSLVDELCVVEEVPEEGMTSSMVSGGGTSGFGATTVAMSRGDSSASRSSHLSANRSQALSTSPPASDPQPSVTVTPPMSFDCDDRASAPLLLHGVSQSTDNLAAAAYHARRFVRQQPRKVPTAGLLQERDWRQVISAWNAPLVPIASRQVGSKSSTLFEQKSQASPHRRSSPAGVQKPPRSGASPPSSQTLAGLSRKRGSSRSGNGAASTSSLPFSTLTGLRSSTPSPAGRSPDDTAKSTLKGTSKPKPSTGVMSALHGLAKPGSASSQQHHGHGTSDAHSQSKVRSSEQQQQQACLWPPPCPRSQNAGQRLDSQQANSLVNALRLPQSSPSRLGPADFMLDQAGDNSPPRDSDTTAHEEVAGPKAFTFRPRGREQLAVELATFSSRGVPHEASRAQQDYAHGVPARTHVLMHEAVAAGGGEDDTLGVFASDDALGPLIVARRSIRDSGSNANSITISCNIPPAAFSVTVKSSSASTSPVSTPGPSPSPSPAPSGRLTPSPTRRRPSRLSMQNSKPLTSVSEADDNDPVSGSQPSPVQQPGIANSNTPNSVNQAATTSRVAPIATVKEVHSTCAPPTLARDGMGLTGDAPVRHAQPFSLSSHSQRPVMQREGLNSQSAGFANPAVLSSSMFKHTEQDAPVFLQGIGHAADGSAYLQPHRQAEDTGGWSSGGGWLLDDSREGMGGDGGAEWHGNIGQGEEGHSGARQPYERSASGPCHWHTGVSNNH